MAGKRSIYSEEIAEFVAVEWASGTPVAEIAQSLGIDRDTIYGWFERKQNFRQLVAKKRIELKQKHTDKIKNADQWQSSAWWLERQYKEEFAPPKQIQEQQGALEITIRDLRGERKD